MMSAGDDHECWHALVEALATDPAFEDVRDLRIEGLDVWPIVKSTLVMMLLNRMQHGVPAEHRFRRHVRKALGRLEHLVPRPAAVRQMPHAGECEALFLGNIAPAIDIGGVAVNAHFDPLRRALGGRGVSSRAIYYDLPVASTRRFLYPSAGTARDGEALASRRLSIDVQRTLAAGLNSASALLRRFRLDDLDRIAARIVLTIELRDRYLRMMEASASLRLLFLTNYYGPHGWAANAAARQRGLCSVDIQHGVQGPFHHAYAWPEATDRQLNVLPDRYLNWSKHDLAHLESQAQTAGRSLLAGPSHFQLERAFAAGQETVEWAAAGAVYADEVARIDRLAAEERQAGRSIVGLFQQYRERPEWLAELRRKLPDTIALWVRRHPGARTTGSTPGIGGLVREMDSLALPAILRNVNLTVTAYSSVGAEAAHVGCPVLSYSPFAGEFLLPYCRETGLRFSTHEPAVLAAEIAKAVEARPVERMVNDVPDLDWLAELLVSSKP